MLDVMERSEEELFLAAAGGCESSASALVERVEPVLLSFFRRSTRDLETARNLFQETLMRAFKYASSFDGSRCFRTWMFAIARNVLKEEWARRSRAEMAVGEVEVASHRDDCVRLDPDEVVQRRDTARRAVEAVMELPRKQREVFLLRHYEGRSCEEIAALLGISVGTVKSRLHYACERLRNKLARSGLP